MNQPPKFRIKIFGVDVSAEGVLGIFVVLSCRCPAHGLALLAPLRD